MKRLFQNAAILAAIGLAACSLTKVVSETKDPTYKPQSMQRVLVIALTKGPSAQKWIEDAFVENLQKRKGEGVASYTLTRRGEQLDEAAWKKIVDDNHFDTVIISRVVDFDVKEEDVNPKLVIGTGSGYGYYSNSYRAVYQPGSDISKVNATIETRVFDVASGKMVFSAHSKTNILKGRDPQVQAHDFAELLMDKIFE